jgi:dipeptidyl aminopeptidase/acylaminoacyl peptidase
VEYVRYPEAGHDLSRRGDPHQRMDRLNRIIEFFERHIDNPRPAPVRSEQ